VGTNIFNFNVSVEEFRSITTKKLTVLRGHPPPWFPPVDIRCSKLMSTATVKKIIHCLYFVTIFKIGRLILWQTGHGDKDKGAKPTKHHTYFSTRLCRGLRGHPTVNTRSTNVIKYFFNLSIQQKNSKSYWNQLYISLKLWITFTS